MHNPFRVSSQTSFPLTLINAISCDENLQEELLGSLTLRMYSYIAGRGYGYSLTPGLCLWKEQMIKSSAHTGLSKCY